MTTLREAAQQALEAMRRAVPTGKITLYEWDKALSDLADALAQQAEPVGPVAWGVDWGRDGDRSCVSITKKRADGTMEVVAVEYGPLYTAPPQRKPLTEEEIRLLARDTFLEAENIWNEDTHEDLTEFARAVERAHGITDPQVKDRLASHGIPKP